VKLYLDANVGHWLIPKNSYLGSDRVQGAGCRVQGAGCRVQGAGCRVQGAGCRVQGSGLRAQGSGQRQLIIRVRGTSAALNLCF